MAERKGHWMEHILLMDFSKVLVKYATLQGVLKMRTMFKGVLCLAMPYLFMVILCLCGFLCMVDGFCVPEPEYFVKRYVHATLI